MSSPSYELTKRIFERLTGENLLSAEDTGRLLAKAADGKMKPEDWRLALEKGVDKGGSK